MQRFRGLTWHYMKATVRNERLRALAGPLTELIGALGTVLVLVVLGLLHALEVKLELSEDKLEHAPGRGGGASARRSIRAKADDPTQVEPDPGH